MDQNSVATMPRPGVKIVILSARNKLATKSRERRRAIRLAVRDQPGASIPLACLCDADKPSVSLPFIISSDDDGPRVRICTRYVSFNSIGYSA